MFRWFFEKRFFITVVITGLVLTGINGYAYQEHERLEYEVNVNAINIPVFAVDSKGDPVFDLRQDEIELTVNKKLFTIANFNAYQVEEQKRVNKEEGKMEVMKAEARVNFIIFDALSNSATGLKQAKAIALGIINESPSTDAFVILESKPHSGFRYITGPETDKKQLADAIKTVSKIAEQQFFSPSKRFREMGGNNVLSSGSPTSQGGGAISGADSTWEYRAMIFENAIRNAISDRDEYNKDLNVFFHSLSQMKYALKTITQPKHVFLVSGGVPGSAIAGDVVRYYDFMSEAAKAINYGGSMLYMINPIPIPDPSAAHSLKFMAKESGGKYFSGSSVDEIVNQVKNSTRAYYELTFFSDQVEKDKLQIKLNCKREGVTLNTVNYAEKGKPYKDMEPLQKKLFAMSVITGGSWSRIIGTVKEVKYKKIKTPNTASASKRITVPLPDNMTDTRLDIFVLNLEPNTMKANIGIKNQTVNQTDLEIDIPIEKDKMQFFVIVDPDKTFCLYNHVK